MKKVILSMLFLLSISLMYPETNYNNNPTKLHNDDFSFEIKPSITSGFITIETNLEVEQVLLVKIIDKSGFLRVKKELHLNKELDVSELREGYYLIKIYTKNSIAVERFYKGKDVINNK